jgi:hypothetical protein
LRFFSWFQAKHYLPEYRKWKGLHSALFSFNPNPNSPNPLKEFSDQVHQDFPQKQADALDTVIQGCLRLIPEERISPEDGLAILEKGFLVQEEQTPAVAAEQELPPLVTQAPQTETTSVAQLANQVLGQLVNQQFGASEPNIPTMPRSLSAEDTTQKSPFKNPNKE